MDYPNKTQAFLNALNTDHPDIVIMTDHEKCMDYQRDESACTPLFSCPVVFPKSTQDIQNIVKLAHKLKLPIVPRGAGSGLNGACVPIDESIIICFEHMNRLLELDEENFTATVEPGMITGDIRKTVEPKGLFYPPVPASVDYCSIGGNIATNAGGLCAVKYGVTREYVRGLEVVLPNGEVIQTAGPWMKCSTGYDLTQLFTGSEGTLGIVSKIILKLIPLPKHRQTLLIAFDSLDAAAIAVNSLLKQGLSIPTMELIPKEAVDCVKAIYQYTYPFEQAAASLLIELDAMGEDQIEQQTMKLYESIIDLCADEPLMAQNEQQREDLWLFRKSVRNSIVAQGDYVEADSVVARSKIKNLLQAAREVSKKHNTACISYGHAGDGNLHTYFLKQDTPEQEWNAKKELILNDFFTATHKLGGTLSGEHGIGMDKVKFMNITNSQAHLDTMQSIKKALDPHNIMNPGKVLKL
ncbi:FAD-binding protein [bacterium]|nr:FAD-binding protein [bacterium]